MWVGFPSYPRDGGRVLPLVLSVVESHQFQPLEPRCRCPERPRAAAAGGSCPLQQSCRFEHHRAPTARHGEVRHSSRSLKRGVVRTQSVCDCGGSKSEVRGQMLLHHKGARIYTQVCSLHMSSHRSPGPTGLQGVRRPSFNPVLLRGQPLRDQSDAGKNGAVPSLLRGGWRFRCERCMCVDRTLRDLVSRDRGHRMECEGGAPLHSPVSQSRLPRVHR